MRIHSFDPISFFFGLVFTAMAAWVLFVDDIAIFDARWAWPVVLIVGGVALLASMITGRNASTPASEADVSAGDDSGLLAEARAELPDEPHLS